MILAKLWFSFKDAIFWECTNAGLLSTQAVRGRWIVGGWRSLSCGAEIRGEPRQPARPQGSHPPTLTQGQASHNPQHFLLPLPAWGYGLLRLSQALKREAARPDQWEKVGGQAGSQWGGEACQAWLNTALLSIQFKNWSFTSSSQCRSTFSLL